MPRNQGNQANQENQGSDNVPRLRFPGFQVEWKKSKLKEITNKIQDGTHFSPTIIENGSCMYLTSKNIRNGYMDFRDVSFISQESHNEIYKRCEVKYGDILITKDGANVGNICINTLKNEFSLLSSVAFIRSDSSIASNEYIYHYICSPIGQTEIKSFVSGQAITRITLSKLSIFKISFPSLPEQQKIASFLTTVDEKLQALKKKKTLLEQYKKGVMQKIFSQEIRFKDDNGKEYPEWEEKKLGEMGETYNGLTGKTKEDFGIGKPYIQYKQIFDDSKIDISRFDYVNIGINEKQNKVLFGDVFFTVSSETPDEIGTASVLLDTLGELYLNSFCFGFRPNSLKEMSPNFSRYLFRNELFRNSIIKLAQGSTRYNMSKIQLMKLTLKLPQVNEQTKIANFLSAIDDKINHCQTQIEKTEMWKKGLLQRMFC